VGELLAQHNTFFLLPQCCPNLGPLVDAPSKGPFVGFQGLQLFLQRNPGPCRDEASEVTVGIRAGARGTAKGTDAKREDVFIGETVGSVLSDSILLFSLLHHLHRALHSLIILQIPRQRGSPVAHGAVRALEGPCPSWASQGLKGPSRALWELQTTDRAQCRHPWALSPHLYLPRQSYDSADGDPLYNWSGLLMQSAVEQSSVRNKI